MNENETRNDDENGTPASPPAEGEQIPLDDRVTLSERLHETEQKRDEYLQLLKAKQAEFENYQKRSAREREHERRYAVAPLAEELLIPLDNLERALEAANQAQDSGPLVAGVQATYTQIIEAFRRQGITRIEALGQPFDPNLHEAVAQQPNDEVPPQTVLQVFREGYLIHDRVLRPASVVVSTSPEEETSEQKEVEGDGE